jgi:hypothetical protein
MSESDSSSEESQPATTSIPVEVAPGEDIFEISPNNDLESTWASLLIFMSPEQVGNRLKSYWTNVGVISALVGSKILSDILDIYI